MHNDQHNRVEDLNADQVIVLGHTVIETACPEPEPDDVLLARVRDRLVELP